MTTQEFSQWRPVLYHVMRRQDQGMVRAYGLRSAAALLNPADVNGVVSWRWAGEQNWQDASPYDLSRMLRTQGMEVNLDEQVVVLRDQHPLGGPNGLVALQRVLDDGLNAHDWLGILNQRVFLFPCQGPNDRTMCEAGDNFRNANNPHQLTTLMLETARLPDGLAQKIELSTINGGAINGMARRGNDTYRPLANFPAAQANQIREITIRMNATVAELRDCSGSPWFNNMGEAA